MIPSDAVVSGDSHLEVPPDAWLPYVPERFREFAPRVVTVDGAEAIAVPGNRPIFNGTNLTGGGPVVHRGASYHNEDGSPVAGAGGPAQRLAEQDRDGIAAEVLYPPLFMGRCIEGVEDKDAYRAMVSAYNTFVAEFCSHDPQRLIGVGVLPKTGVQDAIAELRNVHALGLRAVAPRWFPSGAGLPRAEDDPFWEETLRLGIRVTPHSELGGPPHRSQKLMPRMPGRPSSELPTFMTIAARASSVIPITMAQFMTAGVLDRFPDLVVYLAEVNAGWLPSALSMMDDSYSIYRESYGVELKMKPSEYALVHFRFGIVRDSIALAAPYLIPAQNLVWGSDFPHAVGSWPRSREWLDQAMNVRTTTERRQITRDNTLAFFGLEAL